MDKGQSKKASMIETISNSVIGFTVGMLANFWVLPWFGYSPSMFDSFNISVVFTLIAIARGYMLRRFFNFLNTKGYLK